MFINSGMTDKYNFMCYLTNDVVIVDMRAVKSNRSDLLTWRATHNALR